MEDAVTYEPLTLETAFYIGSDLGDDATIHHVYALDTLRRILSATRVSPFTRRVFATSDIIPLDHRPRTISRFQRGASLDDVAEPLYRVAKRLKFTETLELYTKPRYADITIRRQRAQNTPTAYVVSCENDAWTRRWPDKFPVTIPDETFAYSLPDGTPYRDVAREIVSAIKNDYRLLLDVTLSECDLRYDGHRLRKK